MNAAATKNAVVLISGNGSNLQSIIDHIENGGLNINLACVLSNKSDAFGLKRAAKHGIEHIVIPEEMDESREAYDQRLIKHLSSCQADIVLLAGFMRILSDGFVEKYKGHMLNIHPALLPEYKGLNTHQRVLDAGDSEHGASVHFVTPELDGGPVIMQTTIPVLPDDNKYTLADRLLEKEHLLYPAVIKLYAENRLRLDRNMVLIDNRPINKPLLLGELV